MRSETVASIAKTPILEHSSPSAMNDEPKYGTENRGTGRTCEAAARRREESASPRV